MLLLFRWREQNGITSDSDDEDIEEKSEGSDDDSNSEEDDSDDANKGKGVSSLIEIENPNRVQKKATVKAAGIDLSATAKPELSRKEREQIEKQKAQASYMKRHAEGKTDQAKADLARLAIIKQHRAEAAARREQEKKEKEDSKKKVAAATR